VAIPGEPGVLLDASETSSGGFAAGGFSTNEIEHLDVTAKERVRLDFIRTAAGRRRACLRPRFAAADVVVG